MLSWDRRLKRRSRPMMEGRQGEGIVAGQDLHHPIAWHFPCFHVIQLLNREIVMWPGVEISRVGNDRVPS